MIVCHSPDLMKHQYKNKSDVFPAFGNHKCIGTESAGVTEFSEPAGTEFADTKSILDDQYHLRLRDWLLFYIPATLDRLIGFKIELLVMCVCLPVCIQFLFSLFSRCTMHSVHKVHCSRYAEEITVLLLFLLFAN